MGRHSREQAEATQARILAAAGAMFVRHGFDGASLSAIARKARVAKSLLLHHFGSKAALWDAVELASLARYADEQLAAISSDLAGEQFLRKSCTAYFRFLAQNPEYRAMLSWTQAERAMSPKAQGSSAVSAAVQQLVAQAEARVRVLQASGEIRPDLDPRLLIACFLGLLREWFVVREDLFGDPQARAAADDEYLHTVVTLFWTGLRPVPTNSSVS